MRTPNVPERRPGQLTEPNIVAMPSSVDVVEEGARPPEENVPVQVDAASAPPPPVISADPELADRGAEVGQRWRLADGKVIVLEDVMKRHGGAVLKGKYEGTFYDLHDATGPL